MTTTQHTPGNWTVRKWYSNKVLSEALSIVSDHKDSIGADMFICEVPEFCAEHQVEAKANARLLAQAPRLLDLLKEARGVVQMVDDVDGGYLDLLSNIDAVLFRVKCEVS